MFKESMFNFYLFEKDYVILYNHLFNSIGRLYDRSSLDRIRETVQNGQIDDTPLFRQLVQDGFFVDASIDEPLMGEVHYMDTIYASELRVVILASEQCNFRCKYCYESFKRGNITSEVVDSFILYLRKNLRKYTGLHIDWFGGEPLLAPEAIECISNAAIDLCRKSGKTYRASMTTNGYLLGPEMFQRMMKCNVILYQITVDGLADTHDAARTLISGGPTFERIIQNLRAIRDTVRSQLVGMVIRTNVSYTHLPRFNEYIDFLQAEFGSDSRFSFLFRPAGDWGGERVKSIKDTLFHSGSPVYEALLQSNCRLRLDTHIMLLGNSICYAAQRNCFVLGSDGTLYKCTVAFDKEYNHIGRLDAQGNLLIDTNKLNKWLGIFSEPAAPCSSCNTWTLCHNRSCPDRAFRPGNAGSLNCGYEKESLADMLKVLDRAQSSYIKDYQEEL